MCADGRGAGTPCSARAVTPPVFILSLDRMTADKSRVVSAMTGALLIAVVAIGLINGWMYFQQPRMTFFPVRPLAATPADWGMPYEEIRLETSDGVGLHGWFLPAEGSRQVLLFFHGNAGNISHRGDSIRLFSSLGLNVFIIDYRGYGLSGGTPSERGLYLDADAAWRYLVDRRGFRESDIIIFGRSLGGAVAANLASRVSAGGLILESTLSSARDFAEAVFPLLSRLVVLRYEFDSVARLKRVNSPLLVLHSPEDEVMPYKLGLRLYEAANEPKDFVTLRGDHDSGFLTSRPHYDMALAAFVRDGVKQFARMR